MGRLTGKTAFITGVASGMGRAAAKLFAAEGASVVGCDVSQSAAQQTVSEVRDTGGQMVTFGPVDLSSPAEAQQWISDGLAETGGIDILYNNAGGARFGLFGELSHEDWAFTLHNEVDLVFYATQAASHRPRRRCGDQHGIRSRGARQSQHGLCSARGVKGRDCGVHPTARGRRR
jgi:NAD(P)-dependent dehydrogenase (short-subunit alcohol dehydrogenase family)